jgi:uncharacterized protein with von Willebrand factor type A (vWA) domain
MTPNRRRAPDGLQKAGKRVWSGILAEFDLDERELLVLEQAARQADSVAALEAEIEASGLVNPGSKGQMRLSPTVTELRQARLAVSKLLSDLALPDTDEESSITRRARKAAETRWKAES